MGSAVFGFVVGSAVFGFAVGVAVTLAISVISESESGI